MQENTPCCGLPEEVERFLNTLDGPALDAFCEQMRRRALEGLAGRLHEHVERDSVEVFLSGTGKVYRVESVCLNGPTVQVNVDDTQEPITVVTMSEGHELG